MKVLEEKLETGEYSLVRVPRAREVIYFPSSLCYFIFTIDTFGGPAEHLKFYV